MQELKLKLRGLYTHPSDLSAAPDGALSVADNIIIDQEDVASPRRGLNQSATGFSSGTIRANKLYQYQNFLLAHLSSNVLAYYSNNSTSTFSTDTGAAWTSLGSFSAISGTKVRFTEANQNLYFTTAAGVYKSDAYNATPVRAGAYKGLDIQSTIANVTGNWLLNNYRVAYRVVWGIKDSNKNLILGAPSQREAVTNTAGATRAITLKITIPTGVTTAWFYQVYRSTAVDNSGSTVEPSDELALVYEDNPIAADITNKYVQFNDIVPDELRGATIYTASTQEGLTAGNEQPPLAKDVAVYKNTVFYANTTSKHRQTVTLLGVGGTNGLADTNTVTIDSVVYTAKSTTTYGSEDYTNRYFAYVTGGSASQNIRDTALSLVRVINRSAASTVYAYYLSGPDDLPGKILLEERGIGGATFPVVSNNANCWSPDITSGAAVTSANDRFKNGLFYSKTSQPEAVPLPNFFFAGSAQKEILRIVPLRDSLFILKEDGIYRLSGDDSSNFRVDLFDSTTHLLAPESAVVLNNQIFALTDQGVVAISDGGVQVRSRAIENTLLNLQGVTTASVLQNDTFGVSYETERKYMLFVPKLLGDTTPTQAYVFNTFTNTWTRWTLAKSCGYVNPADNKLYLGDAHSNFVNQERKSYSYQDYVDFNRSITISSVSGKTLIVSDSDQMNVGDVIYQSASVYSTIASVDSSTGTVVVDFLASFAVGAGSLYSAIASKIAWVPITSGNPASLKHFREVTMLFKADFTGTGTLVFSSDTSPSQETETVVGTAVGLWGLFSWGSVPWGGTNNRRPIRVLVPRNKRRSSQITIEFQHATGYAAYQLNGISVIANPGSERVAT